MVRNFDNANILILGGTGSLGRRLYSRISSGEMGTPKSIVLFSRDEAKQHYLRLEIMQNTNATDDVIYKKVFENTKFAIGDVRNYALVKKAAMEADVIFHAAALKQVPSCEYFPDSAIDTNIYGAINLTRALNESPRISRTIVGVSTDKACKPVNVMGMTKALQERIIAQANIDSPWCRFVNVRYGNVMASRGSAIPFFLDLIRRNEPIPVTDARMTRYLMTLNQAVDLIFDAYKGALPGETFIPMVPCAKITDVISVVAENLNYPTVNVGIRPGEKLHEVLVSEEETSRTNINGRNLVIGPILPELRVEKSVNSGKLPFELEYTSGINTISVSELESLLKSNKLTKSTAPLGQEIYT